MRGGSERNFGFSSRVEPPASRESPHKFSALQPINRARVLRGCKTSRCRASIAGVIFRPSTGTSVFPLAAPRPPVRLIPVSSVLSFAVLLLLFIYSKTRCQTPPVSSLRFVFHERVRGRLFLSHFFPSPSTRASPFTRSLARAGSIRSPLKIISRADGTRK